MPKIVIVGGGTAGWLAAAYLSARLAPQAGEPLSFTLVEASDIAPVGVGEATVPSIRDTMAAIGVDEYEFMRECDATFKHGIRFVQWNKTPEEAPGDCYFHPFERPLKVGPDAMAGYWLKGCDPFSRNFADAVSIQQQVSAANQAPKRFEDRSYAGPMPYAYHLDAGKLAAYLKRIATGRGVEHLVGKVRHVHNGPSGDIAHIVLEDGRQLEGDVFIDCTGFLSLLIEKHYGEAFISLKDILFCDKAVVCRVPYDSPQASIAPYTISTAQTAGWIWDIGLSGRRGTGYVYSSNHTSADEAQSVLQRYIGRTAEDLTFRGLDMKVGYRRQHWVRNCIALGLSGGFIEPLESTGIHLIEVGLQMLVQMLPRYLGGGAPQSRFSEIMGNHYDICIDFVKLHYYLSSRTDTAFWLDNRSRTSVTAELYEKVCAWESGYPDVYDLRFIHSIFDHASYQYIFFGMGKRPAVNLDLGSHQVSRAQKIFHNVRDASVRAKKILPDHRRLIAQIHGLRAEDTSVAANVLTKIF